MFRSNQLLIFGTEEFTDYSLPKFKKKWAILYPNDGMDEAAAEGTENKIEFAMQMSPNFRRNPRQTAWSFGTEDWRDVAFADRVQDREDAVMFARYPNVTRFWLWLKSWFVPRPELAVPKLTVDQVFQAITHEARSLRDDGLEDQAAQRIAALTQMVASAKAANQRELVRRAETHLSAIMAESMLLLPEVALGTYITELDLISFVRQSPRGLLLTFVQEFPRAIPQHVLDKKARCDDMGIFDAYVVLHHDPTRKSWADADAAARADEDRRTREAREQAAAAAKDPILFGLIAGRRNLYLVGSWVDEVCTLTFEEIIAHHGRERKITTTPEIEVPNEAQ